MQADLSGQVWVDWADEPLVAAIRLFAARGGAPVSLAGAAEDGGWADESRVGTLDLRLRAGDHAAVLDVARAGAWWLELDGNGLRRIDGSGLAWNAYSRRACWYDAEDLVLEAALGLRLARALRAHGFGFTEDGSLPLDQVLEGGLWTNVIALSRERYDAAVRAGWLPGPAVPIWTLPSRQAPERFAVTMIEPLVLVERAGDNFLYSEPGSLPFPLLGSRLI